ncbi:aldo/keto reductase [Paracoccus sphaerophysae]|uniref:Aldo/keto reductase n=1 Tax=Paracoccus sphaerophysae TaxID=690417 RepID=A0A099F7H9_9RHOB|nr:aldo/keto reductase [Paracoccus sphaerophysae]KGJ06037.1 aldo/keto reductase [Paracoccus sphaerophysae]
MDTRKLGGIEVSEICLGTMTFGKDTGRDEAFAQMDRALDAGITFFDTAEMYPVNPAVAETYGQTEQVIGAWLADRGTRDRVRIATKISGPNGGHSRGGQGFEPGNIAAAVDGSLGRLGTDRIDLYQLHWPKRGSYAFRQNWGFDPRGTSKARVQDHMDGILTAMKDIVAAGKVREFGLSNESAWGTMAWLAAADRTGGPRVVSVQNEYGPLYRMYDTDMAEVGQKENVTLLAYSPLAAGLISGKYAGGTLPPGSRAANDVMRDGPGNLGGRRTARADQAVAAWHETARGLGLDPIHMAIAFIRQRPFPAIPIIGATHLDQLDHLIAGLDLRLDAEADKAIDAFHRAHPLPY